MRPDKTEGGMPGDGEGGQLIFSVPCSIQHRHILHHRNINRREESQHRTENVLIFIFISRNAKEPSGGGGVVEVMIFNLQTFS